MTENTNSLDISKNENNISNILEDSINNVYALTGVGYAIVDEDNQDLNQTPTNDEIINEQNPTEMEFQSLLNNNDENLKNESIQNELLPIPFEENTLQNEQDKTFSDNISDQQSNISGEIEDKVESIFNNLIPSNVETENDNPIENIEIQNDNQIENNKIQNDNPIENNDIQNDNQIENNEIQNAEQEYEEDGLRVKFPPTTKFNFNTPKRINTLLPGSIDFSKLQPLETNAEEDQICEKQLRDFQKSGTIPDNSHQQRLAQYVQRQKVNAIVSNSYKDAAKLETIYQKLVQMINDSQKIHTNNQRITIIQQRIEENNLKIEELNKETKMLIENEQKRLESLRQEKETQQENEFKDFEVKWNDEEFLRKFARPSVDLIQMQSLMHSYVILKEFEAAEVVKKDIYKMEEDESTIAQKNAETSMMKEQEKLLNKHEFDIETYQDYADWQLNEIVQQQNIKMQPLLSRKKKLEIELDELIQIQLSEQQLPSINMQKVTKSAPASSLASSVPTSRLKKKGPMTTMKGNPVNTVARSNSSLTPVMTPRTRERYCTYKTQIRNPRITVKPLGHVIPKDRKKRNEKNSRIRK